MGEGEGRVEKGWKEKDQGNMAGKRCEAENHREEEQTKNHLNTLRLSRAELGQGARTLFLPLLPAHPHIFLVGNLER